MLIGPLKLIRQGRELKATHPLICSGYSYVYWLSMLEHPSLLLHTIRSNGPFNHGGNGKCGRSIPPQLMLKILFWFWPFSPSPLLHFTAPAPGTAPFELEAMRNETPKPCVCTQYQALLASPTALNDITLLRLRLCVLTKWRLTWSPTVHKA